MNPTWDETEDLATEPAQAPATVDDSTPPAWDDTAEVQEPEDPGLLERLGNGAKQAFNDTIGSIQAHPFDVSMTPDEKARISSPGGVGSATDLMMQATAGPAMGKALGALPNFMKGRQAAAPVAKVLDSGMGASGGLTQAAPVLEQAAPAAAKAKPILDRVADFTDVSKMAGGGLGAKGLAYFAPGPLKYVQGVSDAARAAQKVKTGAAYLLETAPQKLGKFAPVLKQAADRGGNALSTTDFLLQKTDPEYQQLMKEAREQ